jgi:hypothetical protein
MKEIKVCKPEYTSTWNPIWPWQYGGKRWTITCGNCEHSWSTKIPVVPKLSAICPACGTVNQWQVGIK